LSLNLSPQNLSPQNISKHILSSTKLITTKLIKLQNLSSIITYQNKTYQLQNLSNKTYQATKLIKPGPFLGRHGFEGGVNQDTSFVG